MIISHQLALCVGIKLKINKMSKMKRTCVSCLFFNGLNCTDKSNIHNKHYTKLNLKQRKSYTCKNYVNFKKACQEHAGIMKNIKI